MIGQQIRPTSEVGGTVDQFLVRAMPCLALAIGLMAFSPAALACGGGGSGSYRKPPRPGHHLEKTMLNPQAEIPSGETTSSVKK
jgi:hypothetical protein